MIKGKVIRGILVGLLADTVKLAINYSLYLLGFTSVIFWQITAARFLVKEDLFTPWAYLIGGVADITVSAGLGIVFIYIIHLLGNKFLFIKGIGFGLAVWVSLFGTLLGQSVQGKIPHNASAIMVTMVAHFFFGLALAVFTRLLGYSKEIATENREMKNRDNPELRRGLNFRLASLPAKKPQKKSRKLRKPDKL